MVPRALIWTVFILVVAGILISMCVGDRDERAGSASEPSASAEPSGDSFAAFLASYLILLILIDLAIGITAGYLIAQDAARRGMSSWGWGVFVFLVWIVALPIYALVRRALLPLDAGLQMLHDGLKRCPYCAEFIRVEAIKCKHCGSSLAESGPGGSERSGTSVTD